LRAWQLDGDMKSLWSFIAKPKNREVLSWIGAGIVAVAAGGFAAVTYLWPAHDNKGDVSHVTINATGATLQASGPLDCGNTVPKRP
jgi:hypothetical protein